MSKKIIVFLMVFFLTVTFAKANDTVNDDIMQELLKNTKTVKPVSNFNYNYESLEKIPVKLKISQTIKTKNDDIYDNKPLEFIVRNPVKYKNKIILNQGAKISANVALYMDRGMNGIPAAIIIDNFRNNNIDPKKLSGVYMKRGFNMTPLVLPIKWALTPFPGIGSLTNFIIGGNAKITPNDTVTIYYYPER